MAQFSKLFPDGTGEGGTFALVGPFAVVQFGREEQRQQQFVQICMKFVKAHKIVERLLLRLQRLVQHMAQGSVEKGERRTETDAEFEFEFEAENEIN